MATEATHWTDSGRRCMPNVGGGNCWIFGPMQLRAMQEGVDPVLAQRALTDGDPDKTGGLVATARDLTIREFRASGGAHGVGGPQTAFTHQQIMVLANDYNKDIDNIVNWENVIAYRCEHGDGHGDDRAVCSIGKGLRLSELEIVRELFFFLCKATRGCPGRVHRAGGEIHDAVETGTLERHCTQCEHCRKVKVL